MPTNQVEMGVAIAEELLKKGAKLITVSESVNIQTKVPGDSIKNLTTALDMYEECQKDFNEIDIAIFIAAVADYRPKHQATSKIKKDGDVAIVKSIKNPDIAAEFGKIN